MFSLILTDGSIVDEADITEWVHAFVAKAPGRHRNGQIVGKPTNHVPRHAMA